MTCISTMGNCAPGAKVMVFTAKSKSKRSGTSLRTPITSLLWAESRLTARSPTRSMSGAPRIAEHVSAPVEVPACHDELHRREQANNDHLRPITRLRRRLRQYAGIPLRLTRPDPSHRRLSGSRPPVNSWLTRQALGWLPSSRLGSQMLCSLPVGNSRQWMRSPAAAATGRRASRIRIINFAASRSK
jgi:hypothetical protein